MKCNNCEAIFGINHKSCPSCGSKDFEKEEFAPQDKEVETVEPVSALVVDGDIDDFGSM